MKNFLIALVLLAVTSAFGQIKLDSLFNTFDVEDIEIDLTNAVVSTNYLSSMEKEETFFLDKESTNNRFQKVLYYINTFGNFSVYGVYVSEFEEGIKWEIAYSLIIYDKNLKRAYIIEYNSRGGINMEIIAKKKFVLRSRGGNLGRFTKLDANLKPITCLRAGDFDRGVFSFYERYLEKDGKAMKEVEDISEKQLSLKTLTYNDMVTLLDSPIKADTVVECHGLDSYTIYHFKRN